MQRLNFLIIKLTLFLGLGILFQNIFAIDVFLSIAITLMLLVTVGVTLLVTRKKLTATIAFGILALATSFSIGILITNLHNESHWKTHYTHSEKFEEGSFSKLKLEIIEILKPSAYQDKYVANLIALEDRKIKGKILLNIDKDSLRNSLKVDDIVFTKAKLVRIAKPLNPHQFDYSAYLKKKYIFHQTYTKTEELLVETKTHRSILGIAANFRETIHEKLQPYHFEDDELAIINAILLGQRRNLSKATYENYAAAGAIHILAVSGLHVGIILMLLQFLLKPLVYFKKGRVLKIILIVALLWCFAIIAGLSPSVVRAVTMFSIVAIGMNLKRPSNIYNTLAISIFVLLLFKPMFLFDVGFQLSYLAVFAIVWIQPMLYKLWQPKLKPVDYFWQVFTVTIAAQIGVGPLSLFYFHQFPGLFFVSNLVIIPVLGFILGFGILIITLALLNLLPQFMATAYGSVIHKLNTFISWIAEQDAFLFKNISFEITAVILSYMLAILSIRFLKIKTFMRLAPLLLTILLIQSVSIFNNYKTSESFSIFHKSRHTLIAFQKDTKLKVHHNLKDSLVNDYAIKNFVIGEHIDNLEHDTLKSVYNINGKLLLVIDSIGVYETRFKPDMVLLRNSPKINLERLIQHINPEFIIADGSNYKSYVNRWEKTCNTKKLPFHATAKKGALTIDYAILK